MARKTAKTVKVDPVRHKDKRKNIPTEELRSFVAGTKRRPRPSSTRALVRALLDEEPPFDPPATGKIAIKVINHYGDEVLKVYEVKA